MNRFVDFSSWNVSIQGGSDSQEALGANAWAISRGAKMSVTWWVLMAPAPRADNSRQPLSLSSKFRSGLWRLFGSQSSVFLPLQAMVWCIWYISDFDTLRMNLKQSELWEKNMYRKITSKYVQHHRTSIFGVLWALGTLHVAYGTLALGIWTFCRAVCPADSLALC